MRRKEERSKQGQTNNKAKQHSTPKVGLEPTTLYTLDRALYQLSYQGSTAGWAQISNLMYIHTRVYSLVCVHIMHACMRMSMLDNVSVYISILYSSTKNLLFGEKTTSLPTTYNVLHT